MLLLGSHIYGYCLLTFAFCLIIFEVKYPTFTNTRTDILALNNGLIIYAAPKQEENNLKLIIHPLLYSHGRIIIDYPAQFELGGSSAMNYIHCTLVTAGFNSFMHIPNLRSIPKNCSRSISSDFNLTSHDIIIIPELAYKPIVASWRSTGARVVVYMLGLHTPLAEQHHTDVIWAPSTTYTRDLYLATGKQVLFAPLERRMYEYQKTDLKGFHVTDPQTSIYIHLKSEENLVFIDNDSNFPPSLQAALEQLPLKPQVTFKVLANIPPHQVPSWFRRAKVVVDLGVIGAERINNEAALFDAIVLVANTLNGMDPTDFPIPNEFKLDVRNETQMFEVIKNCLVNYKTLLPKWRAMKELSLDLPRRYLYDEIPSFFSTRSVKFFLVTSSLEEESAVIPFALHCAVHHPLSRIEARIQNLTQFKRNHDMILKLLKEVTNLSRDWLLLSQRTENDSPTFIDESKFIISIDPRNMIVDEHLPNILLHLLNDKPSITIANSCFGSAAQIVGEVTIWESNSFGKTVPTYVSKLANMNSTIHEEQMINIYALRNNPGPINGYRLASALYATQQQKLLQSMLPLAVPRFIEVMKKFEEVYPKEYGTL
ncbi:unnamed protein product [Rotaria magnacalcarata]|uniref:Uncharacterized protein n=1 Tax=Rotaria magnacalcarata TaxID=392030 RepID=A0A816UIH6_9BILA|nr:unnamed protein product [Rotaria magnacalcarata]CAF2136256.1 unnamed protein product [Rotaria magnacalcarata]